MLNQVKNVIGKELDKEWVELIQIAREMSISIEDIRKFLACNKK